MSTNRPTRSSINEPTPGETPENRVTPSPTPSTSPTPAQPVSARSYTPKPIESQSLLAAGLAILLIVELASIGFYAYYRVTAFIQPNNLADQVEELFQERYPEMREEIIVQVQNRAPAVAQQVSQEMLGSIPDARVDVERFAARQLATALDAATDMSTDRFALFLRNHREEVVGIFETIESAPADVHRLVLQTEADLEKELGVDVQRQAQLALQNLNNFNNKLERLALPPQDLSAREQLERRIARVIRAMQVSYDPTAARPITAGTNSTVARD